jgi:hypothetical protein
MKEDEIGGACISNKDVRNTCKVQVEKYEEITWET